ncbi:MAG TPA: outer membrane beta-barrel protein [Hyphomicrobium sp.]|jgi:opacity protein-like surface antigen
MKRATIGTLLTLTVSAGLIGAMLSPALADGDPYYSNGINPSGVRTPVPAPIPYPVEEADWYFRGDFAAGFGSSPSVNVLGTNLVESVFGPVGQSESFEPSFTGGVGVGYIWGPHIRTDLTVDVHSLMNTEQNGSGTIPVPTSIEDKTKFMSTILLVNAYYDFRTGSPWTPYLGGGVGFAVNQLTRNLAYTANDVTIVSAGNRTTDVQFAAAAMAGVSYDFSTFFAIDVNYRFLHIGGSEVSLKPDFNSATEIGDLNEHQIRAGFRFYVN